MLECMYDYSFALSLFDARNYVSNVANKWISCFWIEKTVFHFLFSECKFIPVEGREVLRTFYHLASCLLFWIVSDLEEKDFSDDHDKR